MRLRPMKLTVKVLKKRLELYPASALRDVLRALEKIELRRGIDYRQSEEDGIAVHKELIIGEYREMHVSEPEIAELLKRAGLKRCPAMARLAAPGSRLPRAARSSTIARHA